MLPERNYGQEFHLNLILSISWNLIELLLFEASSQVFEDCYQICKIIMVITFIIIIDNSILDK